MQGFLDICALFKLVVPDFNEPGTQNLKNYTELGMSVHAGDYCIGEFLGILKRKWQARSEKNRVSTDGYLLSINRLKWKIENKKHRWLG